MQTITVTIKLRWWFKYYLFTTVLFGIKPNEKIVRCGVYVKA